MSQTKVNKGNLFADLSLGYGGEVVCGSGGGDAVPTLGQGSLVTGRQESFGKHSQNRTCCNIQALNLDVTAVTDYEESRQLLVDFPTVSLKANLN